MKLLMHLEARPLGYSVATITNTSSSSYRRLNKLTPFWDTG